MPIISFAAWKKLKAINALDDEWYFNAMALAEKRLVENKDNIKLLDRFEAMQPPPGVVRPHDLKSKIHHIAQPQASTPKPKVSRLLKVASSSSNLMTQPFCSSFWKPSM